MAKILSQIATVIRGSIGGITFTSNGSQSIVARARVAPVNPNTAPQTDIRTGFSGANQDWEDMTQADRDGWKDYAESLVYEGPLGQYSIPGRQVWISNAAFLGYLNNRGLATITIDDTPPTVTGFSKFNMIVSEDPSAPGTGFDLQLRQQSGTDMHVLVQVSLGFNPTRERFKGPWASANTQYISLASGVTGILNFTGLVDGQAYFYRVRGVTDGPGHRGTAPFIGRHIAATNP
jgi:hypothetical protein